MSPALPWRRTDTAAAARARRAVAGAFVAVGLLLASVLPASAAGLVDPLLRFRQIRTAHFVIYFHAGEERLADRLASIVEGVRDRVAASLNSPAPGMTHVILADQSEIANGWASPLPRNTVFLNAAAPSGADVIGRADDWLTLVFTHEYTHVVHLDRSGTFAWLVRGIFGRVPVAFPNLWLPQWQIEGLATWEESTLTGEGRRSAGDFRAIERVAAEAGRPLSLDRASGGLIGWPDGHAAYAAGLGFHEYLVERFGQEALGRLARSTSRRLPFFGTPAYKAVLGESLGSLWRDYQKQILDASAPSADPPATQPRRLTYLGNEVVGPRFITAGCDQCPDGVVYSARNPHGFPSLRVIGLDGRSDRELTHRFMGSTLGRHGALLLFDQQELRRDVGLYSDLYVFDLRSGQMRALTREARLQDPDISPDGQSIAAVRERGGRRDLLVATLPVASANIDDDPGNIRTIASEVDTQFSAPRWSPDGKLIAVERRRLGVMPDVVIVDASDGHVRTTIADARARIVTPAWSADGGSIVAAADFDGEPFDLYEFPASTGSTAVRLTRTNGALWPDVSSDGQTIVFAGYGVDGYDVYSQPYADLGEPPRLMTAPRVPSVDEVPGATGQSVSYSPFGTVWPTSWSPIVFADSDQFRLGGAIAGADVLARHAYGLSATWLVDGPEAVRPLPRGTPDWSAAYAYTRWRPSVFTSVSRESVFRVVNDSAASHDVSVAGVQYEMQAGLFVPVVHVRRSTQALASLVRTETRYQLPDRDREVNLVSSRMAFAHDSSQRYGYSISREHGLNAGATVELARRALGSDGDATTTTVDLRAYLPGLAPHHVVAARFAGGLSRGEDLARQTFRLGTLFASPSVIDFGSDALGLLRGGEQTTRGDRLGVANLEYRFPLAIVERGHGTWPLLLRTIHAAAFGDVGQVRGEALATSVWAKAFGGELSADAVAGYALPFAVTVGVSWSDNGRSSRGTTVYGRLGRAF